MSIVTPFFDVGEVFRETASSVFRQTLQQWEWILVDDGSTDPASLRLLEEYGALDPRIRVLRAGANRGLSAARNLGFQAARADLVFQLDGDDLVEPTALEKMAWHLATHPEYAFTTGFTVGFGSKEYVWRRGFHEGPAFLDENLVTATNLVRRSVHQQVGGYDEANRAGLEDWEFWIRCAARGHWGSTIGEVCDWYRRRDTDREHWENVVRAERRAAFGDRLRREYPELSNRFPMPLLQRSEVPSSAGGPLPFANRLAPGGRRLLFIVPHFELGGADKFNLDLIRQLQRHHGYEVTVVATRRSGHPWAHLFEGLTPDVFVLHRFLEVGDHPLFLRYLLESRQPDAVCVSNSMFGYQLAPYLRAHFPEIPIVDYIHMEEEAWLGGGYPRVSLCHQSQLTRTVVSSEHLRSWLVERGASADDVAVCHTSIDADAWRRDRVDGAAAARRWGVDRSHPVILYAGRICDQKQPKVFGEVMGCLARQHPAFTALVAGDGPELPALEELVSRQGLTQVKFLGAVPNDCMPELLAISDLFFLPSLWEGISLAIYEAMAMEVVPVSARVGGQAELVTPECGVLVRRGPREVEEYTAALLRLLLDPGERRRMARAARARIAERFRIEDMGRRMDALLADARVRAPSRAEAIAPKVTAALLASAVAHQARLADRLELLHLQAQQALRAVHQDLGWRSQHQAGRLLAAAGHRDAALQALEAALAAATETRSPKVETAARAEVANALVSLDPERAASVLEGGLAVIERCEGATGRRAAEVALASLRAAIAGRPPAPAAGRACAKAEVEPPAVSVVIPCYGQAHYLPEAVESVLAQDYQAWEIVIVNDGSPDDTSAVARDLARRHPEARISLVEQPNRGLPAARNAGFRAARGRYVLPLDADDKVHPALLGKLVPILDARPEVGFAYTDIQHFGAIDTVYPLPDFDRLTLLSKDNIACVCSLVRKSVWEQVGGYDESMREGYEDWDFWVGCVEAGWDGHCLHEPLFFYRKSPGSMLGAANQKRERLVATIIRNHRKTYGAEAQRWAAGVLERSAAGGAGGARSV